MHARKTARDAYFPTRFDDGFFTPKGDVVFTDTAAARLFADKVNTRDGRAGDELLRPAELAAMALIHEIFHIVIGQYRQRHPQAFERLLGDLDAKLDGGVRETLLAFLRTFPTPAIYRHFQGDGDETPERLLARDGRKAEDAYTEEVILLWLTNQNPAYDPVKPIVTDHDLGPTYQAMVGEARQYFANAEPFGPRGQSLIDLLLEPSRKAPKSILEQLKYIEDTWGHSLGLDQLAIWRRILWARDFISEEGKYFYRGGPGPGSPLLDAMRFQRGPQEEPKRFSRDLDWMPSVVLMAKTVYVWLDQLSKQYGRAIERLDQIPNEELDRLASSGFTGLWLIGLFERSAASKKIKQMRGDQDAVASAYSLKSYDIAWELGGYAAYENLKHRAWERGIRLAADMVPNHVGIDADWVMEHPDWFLQAEHPPFPAYRFGGPDLSDDGRAGVFIEEGYWTKTDAAVVFRRNDRHTGQDRFIYHGNDGTSMPWNDTAQLDYTKAEVRHAIIETILHVARMFPIIRFDAAMTLAKRHYQRLWFPLPGTGGAIPSRSDYALSQDEFDRKIPVEFWREVVDTVAQRAPDTLLLAEAFWMMEGYFVRSLGMHRVYNSAFMNMLKREENQKYRETIKNVLDFDPEILKRFVNFMNNPDEETAVAQFGSDDKYFGVAILMSTMPGLPMFGHGQVEGLHEKYGMEYRRAKWDERTNDGLVARHEREIFPILKKRYLFSGVSEFALYDFVDEGGGVDEDVYAYSNKVGGESALVLYNNKFKDARGRLFGSLPSRTEDGGTRTRNLPEALGLDRTNGEWLLFRDATKGLEYIRPAGELDGGFFWELGAFKYHVFMEFRTATATAEKPWGELAAELGGRGVPSLERALVELRFRPVHRPLREALGRGHVDYLLGAWDEKTAAPTREGMAALEERLGWVADGLAYMQRDLPPAHRTKTTTDAPTANVAEPATAKATAATDVAGVAKAAPATPKEPRVAALDKARERYVALMTMIHAPKEDRTAKHLLDLPRVSVVDAPVRDAVGDVAKAKSDGNGGGNGHQASTTNGDRVTGASSGTSSGAGANDAKTTSFDMRQASLLLRWIELEATLDLLASTHSGWERPELVDAWELPLPLGHALSDGSYESNHDAQVQTALVLLAAVLAPAPIRESMAVALANPRGRSLLGVHESGGVTWLVKERFDELANLLAERDTIEGRVSLAFGHRQAEDASRIAEHEGYRADRIARSLLEKTATTTTTTGALKPSS